MTASGGDSNRRRIRGALARSVGPPFAALLIRSLSTTLRMRTHGREPIELFSERDQRYVHVFWHAHLLLMVYSYVGPALMFMISQHRDGELIARTVERFGYHPARGSTTRGGVSALKGMIRAVRDGYDIGFTPDGPKGPARIAQPGAVAASRSLGIPIVPVSLGVDRAWRLKTWDRFVIPKPRAHALLAYGEPFHVGSDEDLEVAAQRLTAAMRELDEFANENAADLSVGRRYRGRKKR